MFTISAYENEPADLQISPNPSRNRDATKSQIDCEARTFTMFIIALDVTDLGKNNRTMSTTKKLPVAVSFAEFKTDSNEFLVPADVGGKSCFIGVKSGKSYPYGAVSYLGKEIGVQDIIDKLKSNRVQVSAPDSLASLLESYLKTLATFKIGNILAVEGIGGGSVGLVKVAEMSPAGGKVNLP